MRDHVQALRTLHLQGMADALEAWQADPLNVDRPLSEALAYLIDGHSQRQNQSRADTFFRQAGLATHYSAHTFRANPATGLSSQRMDHLRGLSWIKRGQAVVITGPTNAGKTHLAAGLGHEATVHGLRCVFVRTPAMLDRCLDPDLTIAARRRYQKQLANAPLLIMDDFATEYATTEKTYLLRRLLDDRARRGLPVVVASINAVADWDGYFEDEAAREGIYSRLIDAGCHRVELRRSAPPKTAHRDHKRTRSHVTRCVKAHRSVATP
ncbi:ATP-binding protein [Luteibacter sp. UNCMF366Tsu5.1]|uniref:ATP-binding protein n=1 Tax=Luteibacter sp. UNCMF366Tsu5.1 TaxID=1502758 RepID=UPI0009091CD4|nr:ATP-binding protein [Luteibacter sp. UNCMF366Tsu5.1]SFW74521.1 DNA replication protein DnaC [Luteibacter sp. UNCMF366Tsu5.1]